MKKSAFVLLMIVSMVSVLLGCSCGSSTPESTVRDFISKCTNEADTSAINSFVTEDSRYSSFVREAAAGYRQALSKHKGLNLEFTKISVSDQEDYYLKPYEAKAWINGLDRFTYIADMLLDEREGRIEYGDYKIVGVSFTLYETKTDELEVNVNDYHTRFFLVEENGKWVIIDFYP